MDRWECQRFRKYTSKENALMKYFILSSRGYQATEGMDQDTVIRLLTELGVTGIQFITEDEYNSVIAAQGK